MTHPLQVCQSRELEKQQHNSLSDPRRLAKCRHSTDAAYHLHKTMSWQKEQIKTLEENILGAKQQKNEG
jgi:hypothetical protein